jgi:hypothetical protein
MTQIATPEILRADLPLAATDEIVVAARDLTRVSSAEPAAMEQILSEPITQGA